MSQTIKVFPRPWRAIQKAGLSVVYDADEPEFKAWLDVLRHDGWKLLELSRGSGTFIRDDPGPLARLWAARPKWLFNRHRDDVELMLAKDTSEVLDQVVASGLHLDPVSLAPVDAPAEALK